MDLVDYITNTPQNTNKTILKQLINSEKNKAVYESVGELIKSGQIGHAEQNVFHFDGNTDGRTRFGELPLFLVSTKTPDISTFVRATVVMGGENVEFTADGLTFQTSGGETGTANLAFFNNNIIFATIIGSKWEQLPNGLYLISNDEGYISYIEFAEIIYPINPKYLPEGGVGHTEKEVYTYDGKGETVTIDSLEFAMLVDKAIDPYSIVKIVGIIYGNTIEVGKNDIIVEKQPVDGTPEAVVYMVYVNYGGDAFPVIQIRDTTAAGGDNVTFVISDSDGDGYVSRIETETIHSIDPKYLPDNVVDCDALTCTSTDGKETVMSFSEAILRLFAESLFSSGKAKVKKVIDNNGAFKQAVSGKRSITLKQTAHDGVINCPVTFSIDATSGGIAQLFGFTIFRLVGNVEGSDLEGYCEIKFCIQFTTNDQNVNLMVQATPIQT